MPQSFPHVITRGSGCIANCNQIGSATQLQTPHLDGTADASLPSGPVESDDLPGARKKAQAAILRLWPLEVRYQDYVEQGIDENVVHTLFASLGLDTKSAKANLVEQPQTIPMSEKPGPNATADRPASPPQAPNGTATAATEAPQPAPAVTAESRKDRIARRLMAAKAAKQAAPTSSTQAASTEATTQPPGSTPQQSTAAKGKATADAAQKKAEKERLLQEKLAKLQQSRALRAQKGTEKAAQEPQHATDLSQAQTMRPSPPTQLNTETSASQGAEPSDGNQPSTQPAPPIPGLFLSASGSPLVNPRKRPVASDLNDNSAAPPYKRTFNQHYVDKPLIIDVSDGSDDEDIEMEMSSPVEGPASENSPSSFLPPKPSSFRDLPPLSDKRGRRTRASPTSQASNTTGAKNQDNAKLGNLTQNISELKQKIAELQRQKEAKASSSKESPAQSSANGTPAVEVQQPPATDPTSTRSASPSAALQGSPTLQEPDIQRTLPKIPRARSCNDPDRRQRLRAVSNNALILRASLERITAKQRLMRSELARLEKEGDDYRSRLDEAQQAERQLQAEEAIDMESEQAQLPNGQQQSTEPIHSPSGEEGNNLSAEGSPPAEHPGDDSVNDGEDVDVPTALKPSHPEIDDAEDLSERSLPDADLEPSAQTPAADETEEPLQETAEPPEDTAMDESPPAEDAGQISEDPSPSQSEDAMDVDPASHDEAYIPPEPSSQPETDVQAIIPTIADDTTPPILANPDSQESGAESSAHAGQNEAASAVHQDPDLASQAHVGRSTGIATDLTSIEQAESAPETPSQEGFVPYESVLKGFLSYRFHPNFREDVAGGLQSPTYSNKINPTVQFCLNFLLGSCERGSRCKYQHIDAVGLSGESSEAASSD